MPKKVSEDEKKRILDSFLNGLTLKELSAKYDFSIPTITRQLKKLIGENEFKKIKLSLDTKNDIPKREIVNKKKDELVHKSSKNNFIKISDNKNKLVRDDTSNFFEIIPLVEGVDLDNQKDISSIPLSEINFPKQVYFIVDKDTELEIKYLKDYPDWEFLSQDELSRKTIEIFEDLKVAKKFCKKDQKVIKVPNPDVFRLASSILLDKGISRIINADKLIAL